MAIIVPASEKDAFSGSPYDPAQDKKSDKTESRGGVSITPLSAEGMGLPEGVKTEQDLVKEASGNEESSVVQGAGAPCSNPLSEDSGSSPFPEEEEFEPDDWDSGETLTEDFVKEGRGPGRPVATIWNSGGYPPSEMDRLLLDRYGADWLIWEPETLRQQILDDYDTTLSDRVFDKIMALKLCHSTQAPWEEWDVFEKVILAFNDVNVDFLSMQSPSPAQICYGVKQMNKINQSVVFLDDIKAYIAARCHTAGFVYLPEPLDIAQEHLDKLNTTDEDFKKEIQDIWSSLQNKNLATWEFPDTRLGVQLSYLAMLKLYVDNLSKEDLPEIGNE